MKTKLPMFIAALLLAVTPALAQGTAFTYQGRLNDGANPANGIYDLRFTIYDSPANGSGVGGPLTNAAVAVTNGLFTVTLDFGAAVFTGPARWLEIGVRTNGSVSPHTALIPRQPVTAAPYAQHSANADTVNAVSWNSIVGVPVAMMSNMLGSVGNEALELKVNGQRALRLEPTTNGPNLIGGFGGNFVSNGVVGATIAGGGAPGLANLVGANYGTVGGGIANAALGAQSVVAGGGHNVASGRSAFIGGGGGFDAGGGGPYPNTASGDWSVIAGGWLNNAFGYSSSIAGGALNESGSNALFAATGGGFGNNNFGYAATIAGGFYNRAEDNSATVGGGGYNFASGFNTTIAGGAANTNLSPYATIAGGQANLVEPGADLSAIGGGWLNWIQSGADQSVIAGGNAGRIEGGARESFVGGGFANSIQSNSYNSFIGGGAYNTIPPGGTVAFIGGGIFNTNASGYSTIGGGYVNGIGTNSPDSTVGGGVGNSIASGAGNGTIGGGIGNRIGNNSPYSTVAGGFGNSVSFPAQAAAIGGGLGNAVAGEFATVSGGRWNTSSWTYATVGGGYQNFASGNFNGVGDSATVGGGYQNRALGNNAFVGGGFANYARGDNSTIAGGWLHTNQTGFGFIGGGQQNLLELFARFSVIAGGDNNRVRSNSMFTVISGGQSNQIGTNASYAIIPGGFSNEVNAAHGFAAGRRAKASHPGAFVWADSTDADFASTATNQFIVRAGGGVRLETGGAGVSVDGLGVLAGSVNANQITDGAVTSAKIADGTIVNLDISASAAIADTKLATISTAGKVANSALSSSVSLLGQTIESAEITDGTVVPADLDLAAFNPTFWRTTGNAGTTPGVNFLGTTDNQALAVKVNNVIALQFTPGTTLPNIVGGLSAFRPSVVASGVSGAVIVGGNAPSGAVNGGGAGDFHAVYDNDGTVGGGFGNKVGSNNGDITDGAFATVAGGVFNSAANYAATVAGGDGNFAGGQRSFVGGGYGNQALANFSTAGGGLLNSISDNADYAIIGGGDNNSIQPGAHHSFLGGGQGNSIEMNADYSVLGGGRNNTIRDFEAVAITVAGGEWNEAWAPAASIGGGSGNTNRGYYSTISGGALNWTGGDDTTISGGRRNTCLGLGSTVIGGYSNYAGSVSFATVAGGDLNAATASWSFAAGHRAKANHLGSFVWADSQNSDFASTANNQFNLRAQGGVRLNTDTSMFFGNQARQMLNLWTTEYGIGVQGATEYFRSAADFCWFKGGVHNDGIHNPGGGVELMRLDNGGNLNISGTFGNLSDRDAKQNFEPVNAREVLERVAALPLSKWSYKTDVSNRHIGPIAQDFHASFGVGIDDKHIATVDADGVALAAIQGLNQKLEDKLHSKDAEIRELKRSVAELREMVQNMARQQNGETR